MDGKDVEKASEFKRAYHREWRRKNRDKVRAAQQRYWVKKMREFEAQQQATRDSEAKNNDGK